jgi:putative hydrolase
VLRGRGAGATVLEALHTEQQQEVFDRTIALMTLVEGHADWVTAQAATKVMGDADLVRDRLAQRRARRVGPSDSLLRRLLGLDAKLQQYSDGEAFVSAIVAKVGVEGLNAVWGTPEMVPTRAEITEPNLWLARVHG